MAAILRYVPDMDVLTVGLETNDPRTCEMLFEWADVITVPEMDLLRFIPKKYKPKVKLYDVGPDLYPRPFNRDLYYRIKTLLDADPIGEVVR